MSDAGLESSKRVRERSGREFADLLSGCPWTPGTVIEAAALDLVPVFPWSQIAEDFGANRAGPGVLFPALLLKGVALRRHRYRQAFTVHLARA